LDSLIPKKGTPIPLWGLECFSSSISPLDDVFDKKDFPMEGILFAICGMKRTMVKSIYISLETIVIVWD